MQDFIGSVRRSLVFKPSREEPAGFGGIVEKIGSSIRRSGIGIFAKPPVHALPSVMTPHRTVVKAAAPWMEEEGPLPPMEEAAVEEDVCVVMDMNDAMLVSESAKEEEHKKKEDYIRELEKEVNLLKNLSHPNIVRYLGTAREEDSLNILLEFVPGGSISSLLGKFGSFPESVIRMYTKQLLIGLEYLHENKIMHRDIKGANILVDNKACIKLADFGASKKVEALATVTGAKSIKGTPYWMAPEVIVQSGHSYSADIWSVGCTVIEMATGKAPWSQQYQEGARPEVHCIRVVKGSANLRYFSFLVVITTSLNLFVPGDHDSSYAVVKLYIDNANLNYYAVTLISYISLANFQHPFVTGEYREPNLILRHSLVRMADLGVEIKESMNLDAKRSCNGLKVVGDFSGPRCSTIHPGQLSEQGSLWQPVNFDDDMCQIDDDDFVLGASSKKFTSTKVSSDCNQSYNPMCEPNDDWPCKFDESPELNKNGTGLLPDQSIGSGQRFFPSGEVDCGFTFPIGQSGAEDDDEVTESKIRAFLDEKASELTKLQTPLFQFYNSLNVAGPPSSAGSGNKENIPNICNLPPKSRSPNRVGSRRLSTAVDVSTAQVPGVVRDVFTEIQRKWKEELDEELERTREIEMVEFQEVPMLLPQQAVFVNDGVYLAHRQAGASKTSSPKDRILNRNRDRLSWGDNSRKWTAFHRIISIEASENLLNGRPCL
ncbi:hypothetical protein DH2020_043601 [Rehmannia glutinosa]|uniref:Protein kinase domain-containing protein n=1 Tax=Rehmannia glutinosa TaxID=99300 RepID=A0ABR0UJN8_REHGL